MSGSVHPRLKDAIIDLGSCGFFVIGLSNIKKCIEGQKKQLRYLAQQHVFVYLCMVQILRLKELLKERGMSVSEMADALNVHSQTVSNYNTGRSFPKPADLVKMAQVLDVDIRELLVSTKEKQAALIESLEEKKLQIEQSIREFEQLRAKIDEKKNELR